MAAGHCGQPFGGRAAIFVAATAGLLLAMPPEASAGDICKTIGEKYRAFLASAAAGSASLDRLQVLRNLANAASSGVTLAPAVEADVDAGKLANWAKAQTPPLSIPDALIKRITDNTDSRQDLDHLPNSDFYAVNGTAGTLSCYQQGVYFRTVKGQAVSAAAPTGWLDEDGGACLVLRRFGTVDGMSVAFQDAADAVQGRYDLNVSAWQGDGFAAPCTASFQFSQRLELAATPGEDDRCGTGDCSALRQAALALVKRAQVARGPVLLWRNAEIARLSKRQAGHYRRLAAAVQETGDEASPADEGKRATSGLTETDPSAVPLVAGGKVYLARIGHRQARPDFPLPGWRVVVEQLADGALSEVAGISIDARSDRLVGVTVK